MDAELRRALADLQAQKLDTQQRVSLLEAKRAQVQRARLHAVASLRHLAEADRDARAYQPLGRCFLLRPLPDLEAAAETRKADADTELERIERLRDSCDSALKASELRVRKMVQRHKEGTAP